MDRITHDIRRSNWLEILNRSQQRPVHTTIKQWCLDKPSGSAPTDTVAAVQPTAVFKYKDLTVAVTNEISDTLLSRIIREVTHA